MWLGDQILSAVLKRKYPHITCIVCAPARCARTGVEDFVPSRRPDLASEPHVLVLLVFFLIVVIAAVITITQACGRLPSNTPSV